MIQNVFVVGFEFVGFVERFGGSFGLVLRETNYSQPHPGGCVLRIAGSLFRDSGVGFVETIQTELSDSKKEVGAAKIGFQRERFLKAGNRFVILAPFFVDQSEIEMSFGEVRRL